LPSRRTDAYSTAAAAEHEHPSERSAAAGHTLSSELGGSLGRREAVGPLRRAAEAKALLLRREALWRIRGRGGHSPPSSAVIYRDLPYKTERVRA
jgi:hypothetical protein